MKSPWNNFLIKKKSDDDDYNSDDEIIRYAIKLCINDCKSAISKEKLYEKDYLNWTQESTISQIQETDSKKENKMQIKEPKNQKKAVTNKSKKK